MQREDGLVGCFASPMLLKGIPPRTKALRNIFQVSGLLHRLRPHQPWNLQVSFYCSYIWNDVLTMVTNRQNRGFHQGWQCGTRVGRRAKQKDKTIPKNKIVKFVQLFHAPLDFSAPVESEARGRNSRLDLFAR